jgi:hypothetical protein
MASSEEYAAWIVKNADKKGTPEFDTVAKAYATSRAEAPAPVNKDYQAGRAAPDWKRGLAGGTNAVLLGFGDEALGAIGGAYDTLTQKGQSLAGLVAGTKPKTFAENYVANRDTLRGMQDANAEAHPLATGVNNAIGAIPLMMAAGPAGVLPQALRVAPSAVKVAGVVPNALRAVATGTAVGAVAGAGGSTAGSAAGVAADAVESGVVSGALGGALSPAGAALGAAGRNVAQRMSTSSAAQYAKEKIAEALSRDARGTLAASGATNPLTQAAARLSKLGDEATLADAGGRNTNQLLDTLATLPGRTKEAAYNLLRQRTAGVGDRMRTAAEDALDTQGQRLPTTVESLISRRETDSAPLYAQLRKTSIQPTQKLTDIVAAADELGATKLGREIATARQMPFTLDSTQPGKWQMGDLDHVKQGIDQVLSSRKAMNADGTLTPLGNAYQSLKTRLVGELDAATTNKQTGESLYRNAREAFSAPSALIDAANAGKLAINRDEASIMSTMQGMTANELQAFRIGAFEGLRNKLGTQGGQTDIMNMWKNQSTQEKLKAVFGDLRSYREFASSVAKEAQLKRLQSVGAGSQTAARAAGMGDLDLSALTEAGGGIAAAKSGNLLSALGSAKNVWNRVATPQSVRDQMGSMLLAKGANGAQNLNSLEALVQSINNRNMLLSNNVGMFGGQVGSKLTTPAPSQLK